ncbi:MAG: glycosyltransferase [Cyclobacteriaceae bacterium]|nr:glycosyltransferase [Cyclobacteriaceae bacterium]
MIFVSLLILSLYCLLLLGFLAGWSKAMNREEVGATDVPGISVVVAYRNEAKNIESLLRCLTEISYPSESWEVIVVNDHSTDATADVVASWSSKLSRLKILNLNEGKSGKKAALDLGIRHARFEIIVTTDADCLVTPEWLKAIAVTFQDESVKMVAGPVRLATDDSFFSKLQSMEFASLMGSTAAAIGLSHPIMCNGANLGFRKSVFAEVNGYEGNTDIASGDDEFLMRKIVARYRNGVAFLHSAKAVVTTQPQKSWSEFLQQRLRWAGKWKNNSDTVTRVLALFILIQQMNWLLLLVTILSIHSFILIYAVSKILLECILLYRVCSFLGQKFDVLSFAMLQVLYPIYVIYTGLASLFSKFNWKGRIYK